MKHAVISLTVKELQLEQWRDIPGYEGIYQASTLGRIRSTEGKTTYTELHGIRLWKQRILKTRGKNNITGHRVSLWKNGVAKDFLVARLVAAVWLDMPTTPCTVNHINGNRFDNRIENLEWLSLADNIRHGFETGLYRFPNPVRLSRGNEQHTFRSMSDASAYLGRNKKYISGVLSRGRRSASGYLIERLPKEEESQHSF